MRLIGTVIPFIGFREEKVDDQLRRFMGLDSDTKTLNTFQLEWLGCSVVIPLRPRKDE